MAEIAKVKYTHDAMIDLVIAHPWIRQNDVAQHFGMSAGWVSQVFSSNAFKMRLAERKAELVDPTIILSIEEELESISRLSINVLRDKLAATQNADLAVNTLSIATKAMGLGVRSNQPPPVQNNIVVMVPAKAQSSEEWARTVSTTIHELPATGT